MSYIKKLIRITESQSETLRFEADKRGISEAELFRQLIDAIPSISTDNAELTEKISRLEDEISRLTDTLSRAERDKEHAQTALEHEQALHAAAAKLVQDLTTQVRSLPAAEAEAREAERERIRGVSAWSRLLGRF